MNWQVNDYVVHNKKAEWGVGKVYKNERAQVSVFFIGAGSKRFALPCPFLSAAPIEHHNHPLLDNLDLQALSNARLVLMSSRLHSFKQVFEDGFYSAKYLSEERNYKVKAVELAQELLAEDTWRELLQLGEFAEICNRLGKIEAQTNWLHSFEKIKWHAALKNPSLQAQIAQALFDEVFASPDRMRQFDTLCKVLAQADGCNKWTIASCYGALYQPASRVFIKPEVTKHVAESCAWDIQYETKPNFNTLRRIEKMAAYVFDELVQAGLQPRDMIDVQSFIWRSS